MKNIIFCIADSYYLSKGGVVSKYRSTEELKNALLVGKTEQQEGWGLVRNNADIQQYRQLFSEFIQEWHSLSSLLGMTANTTIIENIGKKEDIYLHKRNSPASAIFSRKQADTFLDTETHCRKQICKALGINVEDFVDNNVYFKDEYDTNHEGLEKLIQKIHTSEANIDIFHSSKTGIVSRGSLTTQEIYNSLLRYSYPTGSIIFCEGIFLYKSIQKLLERELGSRAIFSSEKALFKELIAIYENAETVKIESTEKDKFFKSLKKNLRKAVNEDNLAEITTLVATAKSYEEDITQRVKTYEKDRDNLLEEAKQIVLITQFESIAAENRKYQEIKIKGESIFYENIVEKIKDAKFYLRDAKKAVYEGDEDEAKIVEIKEKAYNRTVYTRTEFEKEIDTYYKNKEQAQKEISLFLKQQGKWGKLIEGQKNTLANQTAKSYEIDEVYIRKYIVAAEKSAKIKYRSFLALGAFLLISAIVFAYSGTDCSDELKYKTQMTITHLDSCMHVLEAEKDSVNNKTIQNLGERKEEVQNHFAKKDSNSLKTAIQKSYTEMGEIIPASLINLKSQTLHSIDSVVVIWKKDMNTYFVPTMYLIGDGKNVSYKDSINIYFEKKECNNLKGAIKKAQNIISNPLN